LRLFSFGGYGLALAALALVVFGAISIAPRSDYEVRMEELKLSINMKPKPKQLKLSPVPVLV